MKDKIRNTVIRNELNTFNFINNIQNNRLNWINNVKRMEPERIPKLLTDYKLRQTGSTGSEKLSR